MFEWLFRYPVLLVLLGIVATVGLFAAWLSTPVTWRDGESSMDDSGRYVGSRYRWFYNLCDWWESRR